MKNELQDEFAADMKRDRYIRETCGRDGTVIEIMTWRLRERKYLDKEEARRTREGREKSQRQVRMEIEVQQCDIFLEQIAKLKVDERIDGNNVDFPAHLAEQRERCSRARRDAPVVEENRKRKAAEEIAKKERQEIAGKDKADIRLKLEKQRKLEMKAKRERQLREVFHQRLKEESERRAMEERERRVKEELERKAREERERKAQEERERKAREERERRRREEQMRKEHEARRRREEYFRLERQATARIEAERHEEQLRLYDAKWHALKTCDDLPPIDGSNLPWPVLDIRVTCLDDITYHRVKAFVFHPLRPGMEGKSRRDRLKMDLLKWHPDKFSKILGKVCERHRAYAFEVASAVIRLLTQMKTEE
jgi:hypothetical protein